MDEAELQFLRQVLAFTVGINSLDEGAHNLLMEMQDEALELVLGLLGTSEATQP